MHRSLIVVLAAALALAGCGRKGALEDPRETPAPAATPTVFGTSPAAAPPPAEAPRPDRPFILDGLI